MKIYGQVDWTRERDEGKRRGGKGGREEMVEGLLTSISLVKLIYRTERGVDVEERGLQK